MKKQNFSQDLEKVFNSKPHSTIQKVIPETLRETPNEKQVSFYIEKNLLKQLKIKALEEGLNFKGIMTEAVIKYLK